MTSNFDNLFEQLLTALQIAEKRHRAVRDSASDNSDWTTYDSEGELISNIIRWRRSLEPLRTEIVASGAVADVDAPILPTPISEKPIPSINDNSESAAINDEAIKVGKYIRSKLRELSESGFRFSPEQIRQLCDAKWSRKVFTYPPLLPFAKALNTRQDISIQTKDENGKNRYWNEVFTFGDVPLLIISQWYAKDKESFDKWYNGLPCSLPVAMPDTLVFRKTVDWSTLNHGITIPAANLDSFFRALGQTINAGESGNIIIEIKDRATEPFRATVIHMVSGARSLIQIRYVQASEIAKELRRIFKITFDYCVHERSLNSENSRVLIPVDLAECIDIYATGTPNTLRFVCFPKLTAEAVDADMTEPESESANIRTKPTKITLLGEEYPIRAWNEMFVKVCEVMLLYRPYTMAAMDKDKEFNTEQRIHFSYLQSEIKYRSKRLSNGLWIETNENSGWTLNACRRLLEKCGFSPDEMQVETMEVL